MTNAVLTDSLTSLPGDRSEVRQLVDVSSGFYWQKFIVLAGRSTEAERTAKWLDVQRVIHRGRIQHALGNSQSLGACEVCPQNVGKFRKWAIGENGNRNNKQHTIEDLIGDSSPMVQLRALIGKAARSDATVLITGENGTGKELVAKALHFESSRRDEPFIDVNAAALTETLVESELFGHERGSFTGAVIRQRGKFEQAHGGSIFFDEIGDLPMMIQAKLLRVLQERSFRRVGGEEKIHIDVRVVAATNRNLEDAMKAGAFRMDLFYRIYVVVIEVPPLRARKSDIPQLARHLLSKSSRVRNRASLEISGEAMDMLCKHSWPGNVRELENAMERALIVCESNEILPSHLPPALIRELPAAELNSDDQPQLLLDVIAQIERSMIVKTLRKTKGNQSEAARSLGLTRRTLSYKMVNLGIEKSPVDGLRPFHASTDDENGDKKAH